MLGGSGGALFYKTKMCRFFAEGRCLRSDDCKYAHDERDLQPMPDFSRTRLCPNLRDGGCCPRGASCSFAHNVEELRARTKGHKRVIDDFRALLGCQSTVARGAPVGAPGTVAQPPPPPAPVMARPAAPLQPVMPVCMPVCFILPYSAPAAPVAQTQSFEAASPVSSEEPCDFEASCGKLGKLADEGLDLPAGAWSRQSTEEPPASAGFYDDFDDEEEESWEPLNADDAVPRYERFQEVCAESARLSEEEALAAERGRACGPEATPCGPRGQGSEDFSCLASACGLSYGVKHSFLDFHDEEEVPALRRVRSEGCLSALRAA